MFKRILFTILIVCSSTLLGQSDFLFNTANDEQSFTVSTGDRLYDDGGANGLYSEDSTYTLTLCAENDSVILLQFDDYDLDYYATFKVYEGTNTNGTLLANYGRTSTPNSLLTNSNCITIEFYAGWYDDPGFNVLIKNYGINDVVSMNGSASSLHSVCTGLFLDSGGMDAEYSNDEGNNATTFCANTGEFVKIDFSYIDINSYDTLYIYDGGDVTASLLGFITANTGDGSDILPFQSSGSCLTAVFNSSSWSTGDGWVATVTCTDIEARIVTIDEGNVNFCNGHFLDAGGLSGKYENNEEYVSTICANAGEHVVLDFAYIDISSGDSLFIYDGDNVNAPLLARLTGFSNNDGSGLIPYHSYGECLTIRFKSNGFTTEDGWIASIECTQDEPNIFIPNGGTYDVCDARFYDIGKWSYNYMDNSPSQPTTFCSKDGNALKLILDTIDITTIDTLFVYDGVGTDNEIIHFTNVTITDASQTVPIQSSGTCLTVDFVSSTSTNDIGWAGNFECTNDAPEVFYPSNQAFNTCSGKFYDNGGPTQDYRSREEDNATTLCSNNGDHILLDFTLLDIASSDTLFIYDGNDNTATELAAFTNLSQNDGSTLIPIQSSGTCLTVEFYSNSSTVRDGWEADISCNSEESVIVNADGNTYNNCNGYIFDSGGMTGTYSTNENTQTTLCAPSGQHMSIDFEFVDIRSSDSLQIFDGTGTGGTLLGGMTDLLNNTAGQYPIFQSTGECLTLSFTSDGTLQEDGWVAKYECTTDEPSQFYTLDGGNHEVCNGYFVDDAGVGLDYSTGQNTEDNTTTFCAPFGQFISFDFSYLQIGRNDTLYVYDGDDNTADYLATFYVSGGNSNNLNVGYGEEYFLPYQSSGQCLTFEFVSDNYSQTVGDGWLASISCVDLPNSYASDYCETAPTICSLDGYQGITSPGQTPDNITSTWTDIAVDNNSWLKFNASEETVTLKFTVDQCPTSGDYIQVRMFESDDCENYSALNLTTKVYEGTPENIQLTGLTPGNSYLISIDGAAGAVCNYTINAEDGVDVIDLFAGNDTTICMGDALELTATSSNAGLNYVWYWDNNNYSQDGQTLSLDPGPTSTTEYTVSASDDQGCANVKDRVLVTVDNCAPQDPCPAVATAISECGGLFDLTATDLETTITGNTSYDLSWNVASPSAHQANDGDIVTVTVSGDNCVDNTADITLNVPNGPLVISGSYRVCGTTEGTFILPSRQTIIAPLDHANATFTWYNDAELTEELTGIDNYVSGEDSIYVLVEVNGCSAVSTISLELISVNINEASINVCGDPNTINSFDLTSLEATIKGDDTDLEITWFEDQDRTTSITDPSDFQSGSTTVYVNAKDPSTLCEVSQAVDLTVGEVVANNITIDTCGSNSEIELDLTAFENQINTDLGYTISWFENDNQTVGISDPSAYTTGSKTIYAYVSDNVDCEAQATITINVGDGPLVINGTIRGCGDNGSADFDLASSSAIIAPLEVNPIIEWYTDQALTQRIDDADLSAYNSSSATIYALVYKVNCTSLSEVKLEVSTLAVEDQVMNACDNGDGAGTFDLSSLESQLPDGVTVAWYSDQALTQSIASPNDHVASNGDKAYAKVSAGNCEATVTVDLSVGNIIANDASMEVCGDANGYGDFDLTSLISTINGNTANTVTFWTDFSATQTISDPANYNAQTSVIFAKVSASEDCFAMAQVNLNVNGLLDLVNIFDTIPDADVDGSVTVDLTSYEEGITNSTSATFTYYRDQSMIFQITGGDISFFSTPATTIYVEVSDNGCDGIATINLHVYDPNDDSDTSGTDPSVDLADAEIEICGTGTVVFDLTTVETEVLDGNTGNIEWYFDDQKFTFIQDPQNFTSGSTIVYAFLEGTNIYAEVTLSLSSLDYSDIDITMCGDENGDAVFNLNLLNDQVSNGNAYVVTWYEDAALTNPIGTPSTYSSGAGTVYAALSLNACKATAEVNLSIGDLVANESSMSLCGDDQLMAFFDLTSIVDEINGSSGMTVNWYADSNSTTTLSGISNYYTGNTVVYAQVYVSEACKSKFLSIPLTVNNIQGTDTTLTNCEEGGQIFDLTRAENTINGGTNNPILWYEDINGQQPILDPENYITTNLTLGTAYVYASVCSDLVKINLNTREGNNLLVDIEEEKIVLEKNEIYLFSTDQSDLEHVWIPETGLDDANSSEPELEATESLTYQVTVTDEFNCTASDTIQVIVLDNKDSLNVVADIFSPNGDGWNDVIGVEVEGACAGDLKIYDRWGVEVFATLDLDQKWDGTYNGKPLSSGSYRYILVVEFCGDLEPRTYIGSILLYK